VTIDAQLSDDRPEHTVRGLASFDHSLELLAQNPEQAEERDQQSKGQAGRGVAYQLLWDLTEGIAYRDNPTRPESGRDEIQRQESGPRQLRYAIGEPRDAADAVRVAMEQDHPDVMMIGKSSCGLDRAFKRREGSEPATAKTPADPEADCITGKRSEPANHDERDVIQCARMRGVAGE